MPITEDSLAAVHTEVTPIALSPEDTSRLLTGQCSRSTGTDTRPTGTKATIPPPIPHVVVTDGVFLDLLPTLRGDILRLRRIHDSQVEKEQRANREAQIGNTDSTQTPQGQGHEPIFRPARMSRKEGLHTDSSVRVSVCVCMSLCLYFSHTHAQRTNL